MAYRSYIACSLDGYVATADGGVDWLAPFQCEDYGYDAFVASIAGVVMGRTTYDQVLGFGAWPYGERPAAIFTSTPLGPDAPETARACPSAVAARDALAGVTGDIWIVGGGRTIAACARAGMLDRLELFIMPVVLGAGRPLFTGEFPAGALSLITHQQRAAGAIEAHYAVGRAAAQ